MQDLYFSINNDFTIALKSDSSFTVGHEDLMLLQGHVPGIALLEREPATTDFVVEHIESVEKKVMEAGSTLTIYDTWSDSFFGSIIHVLYGVARRLYLARDQYPVHGACLSFGEKNVLVVGHSGAGKTSVTLELLRDPAVKLFSGNKTVVTFQSSTLTGIAGTPTTTVKKEDFGLFGEIETEQMFEHWGRQTFLLPPHRYQTKHPLPINAIVIIRPSTFVEDTTQVSYPSTVHALYPYCMDLMNADTVMAEYQSVISGETSIEHKNALITHLGKIADSVPTYVMTGTHRYVAESIKKL